MNESLESRLRAHLAAPDSTDAPDLAAVLVAAETRTARRRRRHRSVAAVLGGAAVLVAAIAVVALSDPERTDVATSPTEDASPAISETPAAVAPAGSLPLSAWQTISPDPSGPMTNPSVVWTGTEAIAIVPANGSSPDRASAYDPERSTWRMLAAPPGGAPSATSLVVWTGTDVLMIGGDQQSGEPRVSAAWAYNVADDEWRQVSAPPLSFVTSRDAYAWTGSLLLVWPYQGPDASVAPLSYDPASDTWQQLPTPPLEARRKGASVWTGHEWLIWGGSAGSQNFGNGAAFDLATATWRPLADSPLVGRRARAVWTGSEMLIIAGANGPDPDSGGFESAVDDGAAYNPVSDSWRSLSPGLAHPQFVPVWTGTHVVLFAKGGASVYEPSTDRWIDTCCNDGTAIGASPIWTGSTVVLLGSTTADAGGATFSPPATESAPTNRSFDEILTAAGVDTAGLPADLSALNSARQCGAATDTNPAAKRCFLDAVLSGNVAVMVEQFTNPDTTVVMPITLLRTRPDGQFDSINVTTESGAQPTVERFRCESIITNEALNASPPPSYDPLFFKVHSCSTSTEPLQTLDDPIDPPPTWFSQRDVRPTCGTAAWRPGSSYTEIGVISAGAANCLANAIQEQRPAEFGYTTERSTSGFTSRWIILNSDGTYEAIELAVAGNTSTWARYSCERPLLARQDRPATGPLDNYDCRPQ